MLGYMYEREKWMILPHKAKAIKYYQKAAANDHVEAMAYLGKIYCYGYGVKENLDDTFELFQCSANKNSGLGLHYLAKMYKLGFSGEENRDKVDELYANAYVLFKSLSNQGKVK